MTTTAPNANEFLMGSGTPAAQFPTIGTSVGGPITRAPEVVQQTDLDTGEPKFWNDGKPMMQLLVTVQTNLRDNEIPDDDGQRTFYIKANSQKAVRDAVKRAGAKGLDVGGVLTLTYSGDGEAKKRGHNPPKLYTATYVPPSQAQANDLLMGGQPAASAYVPPVQQAYVPPAQPVAAAPVAAPVAQAVPTQPQAAAPWTPPPGMNPEQAAAIASLTPEQRAQLGIPG